MQELITKTIHLPEKHPFKWDSDRKNAAFETINKRWIVERTFAWFDNDRRLCRNYELLIDSAEYMTKLSAIKLLLNKI